MRIHLRRNVIAIRYLLSEQHRMELRAKLEVLKTNQEPEWSIEAAGPPGTREFFVGGYWFGYTVRQVGGEPVIVVGSVEAN